MEYDGIITKFKPELLDGLLDDENSCVEVYKKHKEHVTLLPYHLNNIEESLSSILDLGISKYSKKYVYYTHTVLTLIIETTIEFIISYNLYFKIGKFQYLECRTTSFAF